VPGDTEAAAPAETPAAPAPTPPAPEPEAKEPLDPRGAHRRHLARGAEAITADWQAGGTLPPGVPYVKLAPEAYDLPAPPPGRIYVRVRRDVLLIDPVTRLIEKVAEPEG
jgi:hypothetical protein